MWRPLLLLALWLGTVGMSRAQLTAAQHQGLQVALEEFHKHPRVQWAFQKTSMDSATDTVSGTAHGGEGGPHPKMPAHSREARTEAPSSLEKGHQPSDPLECAAHCREERWVTSRNCSVHSAGCWPSSVCLSVVLPGGDICEAGIQAPADKLREEGLEESRLQSQVQRGEWMCVLKHLFGCKCMSLRFGWRSCKKPWGWRPHCGARGRDGLGGLGPDSQGWEEGLDNCHPHSSPRLPVTGRSPRCGGGLAPRPGEFSFLWVSKWRWPSLGWSVTGCICNHSAWGQDLLLGRCLGWEYNYPGSRPSSVAL